MKYLFLSLIIAILPLSRLIAQDDDQQDLNDLEELFDFEDVKKGTGVYKFHLGLRGGINFAKIKSSPSKTDSGIEEAYLGYLGQLIVGYKLNNTIALILQSGLSQQGISKVNEDGTLSSLVSFIQSETALVDYRLDYIETNLLVNILIPTGSNVVPYIFAGPSYSYLWQATAYEDKVLTLESGSQYSVTNTRSATKDFKKHDYGVYVGIGAEVQMDRTSLFFDGGYRRGFYNISNTLPTTTSEGSISEEEHHHTNPELFNTAWNISAGVAYKIF